MSAMAAAAPTAPVCRLWRIAAETPGYRADDLSGAGAERTGGRWNAPGTPVLYTSPTVALAVLETLVHIGSSTLPLNRYLVRLDVPQDVLTAAIQADGTALSGWDALPADKVSIDWGTAWCAGLASALALVPSVVVPEENNVLVNPRHPDARRITATKVRRWVYDPRAVGAGA